MIENTVLRKVLGPKTDGVTGYRRILHAELRNLLRHEGTVGSIAWLRTAHVITGLRVL